VRKSVKEIGREREREKEKRKGRGKNNKKFFVV
jgi:hypothetical protein